VIRQEDVLDKFKKGRQILLDLAKFDKTTKYMSIVIDDVHYSLVSASLGRNRVLLNLRRKE
jgi:hypothetical protein